MIGLIDHLVMLLSTDWFKNHWAVIGIELDAKKSAPIREGCREVVEQITSGVKEYWLTNFSDDRKWETRLLLEALVKKFGVEQVAAPTIREWSEASNEELDAGAFFASLTEDLLSEEIAEQGPDLDCSIKSIVAGAEGRQDRTQVDFEQLCLESRTDWDGYMRGLTPELPTALPDKLVCFLQARAFKTLWFSIREELTPVQKQELIVWYRVMAESRAGWVVVPNYLG